MSEFEAEQPIDHQTLDRLCRTAFQILEKAAREKR
jgi:hypothetical protein